MSKFTDKCHELMYWLRRWRNKQAAYEWYVAMSAEDAIGGFGLLCIVVGLIVMLICGTAHGQQLPFLPQDGTWWGLKSPPPPVGMQYSPFDSVTMSANNAPSPFVILADSEYSESYQAYKAFDRTLTTYWNTTVSDFPHWIQIDCGSGQSNVVGNIYLQASSSALGQGFKTVRLEGSQDGVTYATL